MTKYEVLKEKRMLEREMQLNFVKSVHEKVSLYFEKWNRKDYEMLIEEEILFNEIKNMINNMN